MKFWKVLEIAVSLGSMIRGSKKQLELEGLPVPEVLEKASAKADQLETILGAVVEGDAKEALDEYDRFLDRTAEMGAGLRLLRVLADGTLDMDDRTGEPLSVNVPPFVAKLADKAVDVLRADPPPAPVDETPASP